jgi:hypothetical protein
MEDLVRYLSEIVEPTIADFEQNPTSVRHAFLACVAAFHSIDYLAYPAKPQRLRQLFRRQSMDFVLVDYVAHAFKHVASGNPSGKRLVSAEVISRPAAIWGSAVWDLSRWDDATGGVTLDNDRSVDLLTAIKRTVDFLRKKTLEGEVQNDRR